MPVGPGFALRERYVLEEQVGRSRLGPIYRAVDQELTDDADLPHHVAVQLLPEELAEDEKLLQRFKREFLAMQSWSHPNVPRVLAFERDQGRYFLIMEYLEGETLRGVLDELDDERLSKEEVFAVTAGIGNALGYAHSHGVVHAGVNAENVFITGDYEVRLINFAPAEVSGGEILVSSADRRDDVRGLACLAYELLAGQHPFAPGGRRSTPLTPERPPGLTRREWKALERALASNREQRFPTVSAFMAALGLSGAETLAAEGVAGGSPEPAARARKLGRRLALALGLLAIGVAAGYAYLEHERLGEMVESSRESVGAMLGASRGAGGEGLAPDEPAAAAPQADAPAASAEAPPAADRSEPTDETARTGAPGTSEGPPAGLGEPQAQPSIDEAPAQGLPGGEARSGAPGAPADVAQGPPQRAADADLPAPAEPGGSAAAPAPSPGRFMMAAEQVTVRESAGAAPIVIERVGGAAGAATVVWHTRPGSAVPEEDYIDLGVRTERFEDGETSRTVYVPLVVDAIPGDDGSFYVHLEEGSGAPLGAVTRTTVLVIDDS